MTGQPIVGVGSSSHLYKVRRVVIERARLSTLSEIILGTSRLSEDKSCC
jgi:hypothetical protein